MVPGVESLPHDAVPGQVLLILETLRVSRHGQYGGGGIIDTTLSPTPLFSLSVWSKSENKSKRGHTDPKLTLENLSNGPHRHANKCHRRLNRRSSSVVSFSQNVRLHKRIWRQRYSEKQNQREDPGSMLADAEFKVRGPNILCCSGFMT
ncbi:hypothetical protein PAMP_015962 [Pampus punctatissimus]